MRLGAGVLVLISVLVFIYSIFGPVREQVTSVRRVEGLAPAE
jgi:hypothetical protein